MERILGFLNAFFVDKNLFPSQFNNNLPNGLSDFEKRGLILLPRVSQNFSNKDLKKAANGFALLAQSVKIQIIIKNVNYPRHLNMY